VPIKAQYAGGGSLLRLTSPFYSVFLGGSGSVLGRSLPTGRNSIMVQVKY
jgi:hypothetical protein